MEMGSTGMSEHAAHAEHMPGVKNTLPMMTGQGPFGGIEMGGMFTVVKVRAGITSYEDPGWYEHPQGTVAYKVTGPGEAPTAALYTCPMHPDVIQSKPGQCPKCGMTLVPKR
jgi:manganese oxidase